MAEKLLAFPFRPADKEVYVNQKKLILGGVVLVLLLALCISVLVFAWGRLAMGSPKLGHSTLISELTYCNDGQNKPCVVSFSTDSDGNMLVNLLLPGISYPTHYLKITRNGEIEGDTYACRWVASSPNSAYCTGPMMPPGQSLHLMLIARKDDTLLAEGDLSIIGLAFPTLAIISPTPGEVPAPTESTAIPLQTEPPDFVLPTSTEFQLPIPTPTQPSYPNPSYP
jgi:hypothetical protein